jgi:sphinganine C4-monooxygenase
VVNPIQKQLHLFLNLQQLTNLFTLLRAQHDNCKSQQVAASTMANTTGYGDPSAMLDLPPLPAYTLSPVKPLLSYISDFYLSLILPIAAYWILSMVFHYIDIYDIWPQYRLHTPAEILKRNHVSRYEVARDVIIQQIIQTLMGAVLGLTEPEEMMGRENYDIATWATRLRVAQRALPKLLGVIGLNAAAMSKSVSGSHPIIAGVLAGGNYPLTTEFDVVSGTQVPAFAQWEVFVAKAIYWYLVPALQFALAIVIVDTWQYFLHRAMHMNKWLYSKYNQRVQEFPNINI